MFDDIKDAFAKLSIARLQKRIDALKAHQEMLNKFAALRTLSELEHYRLQLSIGVATIVLFGMMSLVAIGVAASAELSHYNTFEKTLAALFALMLMLFFMGLWESHAFKTIKFWQVASPINRAELQQRIDVLERTLTQSMAKRFGWSAKQ
jgi:hypothetical protein